MFFQKSSHFVRVHVGITVVGVDLIITLCVCQLHIGNPIEREHFHNRMKTVINYPIIDISISILSFISCGSGREKYIRVYYIYLELIIVYLYYVVKHVHVHVRVRICMYMYMHVRMHRYRPRAAIDIHRLRRRRACPLTLVQTSIMITRAH